ncbi:protein kinase domain-containing protein [Gemmatimonas sp.]|uniref:protein kinase domain-containing protein n=1 Tax=Gemmatimonas sp. TaxID=1962908 RepID=UPI00398317FA
MSAPETLERLRAALAGSYHVERELGAGGMATVYLAHDLKHDRDVAIKVLHPDLGAALGGERFLSEIRTTARLQHPHILGLLDSGAADGLLYYVMPYVRGETLRARLDRETQLPVSDALAIATAVADALADAHAAGIIHRDIKPDNILLQQSAQGTHPLVADFGIALAVQQSGGARMTQTGLSLGTPQYMAPEQAMGDKQVDARADIYALGAITYEMLAGEPPYTGANAQAIVAKLLTEAPRPLAIVRPSVPEHVDAAILVALQKLPADRFATVQEFKAALLGAGSSRTLISGARTGTASRTASRNRWLPFVAALVPIAGAGGWIAARDGAVANQSSRRVEFAFNAGPSAFAKAAIGMSPDGRSVLQAIVDSAEGSILVQRLVGSPDIVPVKGSGGGSAQAYSPDGRSIVFVADGRVRKIPVEGGTSTVLADTANPATPAWGADGFVYYASSASAGLARVRETGGAIETVTKPNRARNELGHWHPAMLPDNKAVLYGAYASPVQRSTIQVVELATGQVTTIIENGLFPRYVEPGYILFGRGNTVFAVPFDAKARKVLGPAVPVVEDVASLQTDGSVGYDVSRAGDLVYLKASESVERSRVVWVARDGTRRPAFADEAGWADPRLSPDGRWIALTHTQPEPWSLWLFDRQRGSLAQLSNANGANFAAVWALDSKSLYHAVETPAYDLGRTSVDGAQVDTLLRSNDDKHPTGIAPDGRTLFYTEIKPSENGMLLDLASKRTTRIDATHDQQMGGTFSPDGRWIAYSERQADGRSQVIARLIGGGSRVQVSINGGDQPRFTRAGREIVFRKGREVYAATFEPATGSPGRPALLFQLATVGRVANGRTTGYDVTPDGSEFLMIESVEQPGALPTRVILGWREELMRRVPRK